MAKTESGTGSPWHVRTNSGVFHSGHGNAILAEHSSAAANKQAEKLGITTRYVVTEREGGGEPMGDE